MELVTAVITTYKREVSMVERALKSVLSQTYKDIEIIVVDDSPENYEQRILVKKMVESYKVKYISHSCSLGACVARNTGLAEAKGSYIAFLDDDDEWLPEKIEKQILKFDKEEIALVYCGSKTQNDITGELVSRNTQWYAGKIYDVLLMDNYIGSTSFPLIKTHALRDIGGFDPLMPSAQDYDVWLRLAQKYEVSYVNEPLVIYHVHDQVRITGNFKKKIVGLERINEKNAECLRYNKRARWIRILDLAPMYAGDKQLGKAITKWIQAVAICPECVYLNARYLAKVIRCYFI